MSAMSSVPHAALPKIFAALAVVTVLGAVLLTPDREARIQQLMADGKLGAALELIETGPEEQTLSERAIADRVDLNLGLGRIEEALALIDAVLSQNPQTSWARAHKDEIVSAIGSLDQRRAWAAENFARAPTPEDFRYLLGMAQMRADAEVEADLITRAMELGFAQPKDIERLGLIHATQGQYQKAVDLLEELARAGQASQAARLALFALMTQMGQIDHAIETALATGLDPSDPSLVTSYAAQSRGPSPESMQELIARFQ